MRRKVVPRHKIEKFIILFSLMIFCNSSFAMQGQLAVKGGTWSFATENVGEADGSASGVGAYAVEVGYRISPSWLINFGVNLIFSDLYSGSAGYGFDLGGKYFFLSASGTETFSQNSSEIIIKEKWRPYIGGFIRQRLFGLNQSTSYMGPGVSVGLDYSLQNHWLITAEFRYDYLYGQGDALAIQNNILLGIGLEF
ncbi:MAG: hypothetical protein AAF203_08495 [Pseudomonadota bacterium]